MPHTEHAFIQMSDGVGLSADLYTPKGDGPWPAILEALPYRKDDITAHSRPEYERLRDEGYVVCRVDVRGTGSSQGVATDEYPAQEQLDMVQVIRWLGAQPWSTGSVGMYGTSYSGFNSIQVAMERPPELKAIIPIFATDDRYADDVHYFGGVLKHLDIIDYPAYMVALNALPPTPSVVGESWREAWEDRVRSNEPWILTWLEHQRFDDYWRHGSLRPDYDAIEAATLIVAGWADGYTNNSLRTMAELRCPKRLILGPWAHASIETSSPGPNVDIVAEHLRWWDRWLKGEDNGVDREPEIVLFARRSTLPDPVLREYRGEWRFEPGWPLDRVTDQSWELEKASAPRLGDTGPDTLAVRGDVGTTAWISCAGALPWGLPADQRPDEAYSLVYEWEPLDEELEILGHPRLRVTVTSSEPVAYLAVKLCDVFPDGTSSLVTRGLLNLTHRESREDPEPLEPGRPTTVELELEVTSWTFEPGHRIRLDIAGTDWPNAWAPPAPTTLTVERAGAVLSLPIVDGPSPVRAVPDLRPPQPGSARSAGPEAPGTAPSDTAGAGHRAHPDPTNADSRGAAWRIDHDVLARETSAVAASWGWTDADDHRPRFWESYQGTVWVSTQDPGRAGGEAQMHFRIEWPEATVESRTRQQIRSDSHSYRIEIDLELLENEQTRWTRRWERTIPRDLQ